MKKNSKFKYLFLLATFILSSSIIFCSGNGSDNFNGSSTVINSLSNTSDNFNGSSTVVNSINSTFNSQSNNSSQSGEGGTTDTTLVQSNVISTSLTVVVSKIASFFDAIEGGANINTSSPLQQEQIDLFSQPLSAEAEAATEVTATSNSTENAATDITEEATTTSNTVESTATETVEITEEMSNDIAKSSTRDYY